MWIEIFKTGKQTDSAGNSFIYTQEHLEAMANYYNSKVSDDESCTAPVVKGHPLSNHPAYGWVERLAVKGNILLAQLKDMAPEFITQLRQKMFRKVSVSLYPDLMLRHVGFLGAVQPAVKGLKPAVFAESDFSDYQTELNYDLILFNDERSVTMQTELEKKLEEMSAILETTKEERDNYLKLYTEQSETNTQSQKKLKEMSYQTFLAEERAFCENLIKQGKMLPKEADENIDILLSLRNLDEFLQFKEEDNAKEELYRKFRQMLANRTHIVSLDKSQTIDNNTHTTMNYEELTSPESRRKLHERIMEISEKQNKPYAEILESIINY